MMPRTQRNRKRVAVERGWYAKWAEETGWVGCDPGDPDGWPDLNRADLFIAMGRDRGPGGQGPLRRTVIA